MAEILGIAASGIALAEVAGKIVTASLTVKRLLDDINEIPETFQLLLDQIAVLTPVLAEASCDAKYRSTIPGVLDGALVTAAAQCGRALDQLQALASELSQQIEHSRGFRRSLLAARIALRKDAVAKHERRLNTAVQMLLVAQQTCILSLQRMQPGLLASLIADELEARDQSSSRSIISAQHTLPVVSTVESVVPATKGDHGGGLGKALRAMRFGLQEVTGVVEIQLPLLTCRNQASDTPDGEELLFWVRLQLPSWLSSRIIDSAMYQSHWGWSYRLRTYNVYRGVTDNPFLSNTLAAALQNDDVGLLRRQFESRTVTPFDELEAYMPYRHTWSDILYKENLLTSAIGYSAWTICNYLLDNGVGLGDKRIYMRYSLTETARDVSQLTRLLQGDTVDDEMRIRIFAQSRVPLARFIDIRRSVWPDAEFYAPGFRRKRFAFVELLLANGYSISSLTADIVRCILADTSVAAEDGSMCSSLRWPRFEASVLIKMIPRKIAFVLTWIERVAASSAKGYRALLETYRTLATEIISANDSDSLYHDDHSRSIPHCLSSTLEAVLMGWKTVAETKHQRQLRTINRALTLWLDILVEAGIDLEFYGELETSLLFSKPRRLQIPFEGTEGSAGQLKSRAASELVWIEYGPRPRDWRLWWTEPTDVFVGEFWRGIEEDKPRLPGSWVDDEDEDD